MPQGDFVPQYRATRARIIERVTALDDADTARRVPACPAWTIRDALAHVTGIAADLGAGRMPGGNTQAWIDGHVAQRRDQPVDRVADEWLNSGVEGFIEKSGSGQLLLDVCAHEHDIFHALGESGDRESDAVHTSVSAMAELLRKDLLAKGAPAAVALHSRGRSWTVGEGPVGLMLEAEPFELLRIFGSRRSEHQMRALPWQNADGSPAEVGPWLALLAHFPYPFADLVE
ncbi:MAG: maleylpyruvate isomerase N-terminal domain-containing protein [Acidimicrobiales bacterium]